MVGKGEREKGREGWGIESDWNVMGRIKIIFKRVKKAVGSDG